MEHNNKTNEPQKTSALVVKPRIESLPSLQLSPMDFLKAFSPVKCLKQMQKINTPVKCAKAAELPTLVDIKLKYGDDYLVGYFQLWIDNLEDFVGQSENTRLTSAQLEEITTLCLDSRGYLNIADVNIVFTNLKKTITGNVTGQKIVKAFEDYDAKRAAQFFEDSLKSHDKSDPYERRNKPSLFKQLLRK